MKKTKPIPEDCDCKEIYTPYVTRKGKRIYPKKAKYFHFVICKQK